MLPEENSNDSIEKTPQQSPPENNEQGEKFGPKLNNRKKYFSLKRILVFAVIFAAVGGYFIYKGFAATPKNESSNLYSTPTSTNYLPCTKYLSNNGTGNGVDKDHPASLDYARRNANPGDVWCFMPGTYNLTANDGGGYAMGVRGGTANAYIVYRSYDPNNQAVITQSFSGGGALFKVTGTGGGSSNHGYYIEFNSLTFDGQGKANSYEAIMAGQGAHHIRYINNVVHDMSDSGLAGSNSDYLTAIGNKIYHNGPGLGNDMGGSGITFNQNCDDSPGSCSNLQYPYDTNPGFHDVIVGNLITGTYDTIAHQDGNGIIIDRGGNTLPAVLIANNVVYMNGGRGIHLYHVTNKIYLINNTLYKDGLDKGADYRDMNAQEAANDTWANNIVYAWNLRYSYSLTNPGPNEVFQNNIWFYGKGLNGISSGVSQADPLFINAPNVADDTDGQWANGPLPSALGNALQVNSGSPAIDSGVDPRTLSGLDSIMLNQINQYAMKDIRGVVRPVGAGFDLGAYER